jgi:hypothetical protein
MQGTVDLSRTAGKSLEAGLENPGIMGTGIGGQSHCLSRALRQVDVGAQWAVTRIALRDGRPAHAVSELRQRVPRRRALLRVLQRPASVGAR